MRPRLAPSWKSAAAEPSVVSTPAARASGRWSRSERGERRAGARAAGHAQLRLDVRPAPTGGGGGSPPGGRSIGIQPVAGPGAVVRAAAPTGPPSARCPGPPHPSVRGGGAAGRHRLLSAIAAHRIRSPECAASRPAAHYRAAATTLVAVSPQRRPSVVLVGPPGAGKTTVGRVLARRLGLGFTDVDALIVQRAGKPIADMFTEDGEDAFRALERPWWPRRSRHRRRARARRRIGAGGA